MGVSRILLYYIWELGTYWDAFLDFSSAKAISWIGATCFQVVVFCILHRIQRPKDANDCLAWIDPPTGTGATDQRNGCLKGLNPRFYVLASEHQSFVERTCRGQAG